MHQCNGRASQPPNYIYLRTCTTSIHPVRAHDLQHRDHFITKPSPINYPVSQLNPPTKYTPAQPIRGEPKTTKSASDPIQSNSDHQIQTQAETVPMLRKIIPIHSIITQNNQKQIIHSITYSFTHKQSFIQTINSIILSLNLISFHAFSHFGPLTIDT